MWKKLTDPVSGLPLYINLSVISGIMQDDDGTTRLWVAGEDECFRILETPEEVLEGIECL